MADRWLKPGVFFACLAPLGVLIVLAIGGSLGPDPAEAIMGLTGEWTLWLLALTLLASPLRQWLGEAWPLRLRRMLGLFCFAYACVHLAALGHFYAGWSPAIVAEELVERPYITAGFAAWLLLLPLALTSTRAMQRRLGRRWLQLHRLVYPVAILACVHLAWQARSDIGEALAYSLVFAVLLGWRLRRFRLRGRGAKLAGN